MDFNIFGVIQGFLAKLNCFLDNLVKGKCLSTTLERQVLMALKLVGLISSNLLAKSST